MVSQNALDVRRVQSFLVAKIIRCTEYIYNIFMSIWRDLYHRAEKRLYNAETVYTLEWSVWVWFHTVFDKNSGWKIRSVGLWLVIIIIYYHSAWFDIDHLNYWLNEIWNYAVVSGCWTTLLNLSQSWVWQKTIRKCINCKILVIMSFLVLKLIPHKNELFRIYETCRARLSSKHPSHFTDSSRLKVLTCMLMI